MKVSDFIAELQKYDQNLELCFVVEGVPMGDPTLKLFVDEDDEEYLDVNVV